MHLSYRSLRYVVVVNAFVVLINNEKTEKQRNNRQMPFGTHCNIITLAHLQRLSVCPLNNVLPHVNHVDLLYWFSRGILHKFQSVSLSLSYVYAMHSAQFVPCHAHASDPYSAEYISYGALCYSANESKREMCVYSTKCRE